MVARTKPSLLQREIGQRAPFASLAEEAFLNLERSSSLLSQALAARMKPHGLTPTQYNVLRILRGAHPRALSCSEIGRRLVSPTPDVTRLVDRLEKRGWIERRRASEEDRRLVMVGILPPGLELLGRLDDPLVEWLEDFLGHLEPAQLRDLIRLLEDARRPLLESADETEE